MKTTFYSSQRNGTKNFEINFRSVYAICQGMGLAGLKKFVGTLGQQETIYQYCRDTF